MTVEPNYMKNLKEENEKLKQYLLRAEAMEDYWKIHSSELEEDITKLKQKKKELVHENVKLQNLLYVEQMNEEESNYKIDQLKEENEKLDKELYYSSNKVIELQLQLYDANIMKTRLLKILNETDDYT